MIIGLPLGDLEANCYIVYDESGAGVVVDPGGDVAPLLQD